MQQNSRECEERNKQLREEREHVQKHFQELATMGDNQRGFYNYQRMDHYKRECLQIEG